jgi:hypothetical protein
LHASNNATMHVAAEAEVVGLEDGMGKLAGTQPRPPLLFLFPFSTPTSSRLSDGCLDDITYHSIGLAYFELPFAETTRL